MIQWPWAVKLFTFPATREPVGSTFHWQQASRQLCICQIRIMFMWEHMMEEYIESVGQEPHGLQQHFSRHHGLEHGSVICMWIQIILIAFGLHQLLLVADAYFVPTTAACHG